MPHPDDLDQLETDPMTRALAGLRPRAQRLGARLGLDPDPRQPRCSAASSPCSASARRRPSASSGFFLDAVRVRRPPHGGFAFGIDRLVAILAGEENIREVIAFPKTQSGADPMTNSPLPVDPAQLAALGIRVLPVTAARAPQHLEADRLNPPSGSRSVARSEARSRRRSTESVAAAAEAQALRMITALHTLVYADDAEQAGLRWPDVLGWPHVDAGHGWLIFRTGPSEMGITDRRRPRAAP